MVEKTSLVMAARKQTEACPCYGISSFFLYFNLSVYRIVTLMSREGVTALVSGFGNSFTDTPRGVLYQCPLQINHHKALMLRDIFAHFSVEIFVCNYMEFMKLFRIAALEVLLWLIAHDEEDFLVYIFQVENLYRRHKNYL